MIRTSKMIRLALVVLLILTMAANAPTAWAAPAVVKPGDRNASVQTLQKRLSTIGHAVPATGFFGAQTKKAVIAFQKSAGLKADAIVGPSTWAAIEKRVAAKNAVAQGIYIVQKADTIRSIAAALRIKPEDLADGNSMSLDHPLYIGQALTVPTAEDLAKIRSRSQLSTPADDLPVMNASAGQVSLTFDDAPGAEYFEQVLDALTQHGATATFFVTEATTKRQPALVLRAASAGHGVENHGVPLGETQGPESVALGIRECSAAIRQLTGKQTCFYRPLDYSGGVDICKISSSVDHQVVMWTNLGNPEAGDLLSAAMVAIADGAIIRLSLNDPTVPQILGSLLDHIRAQGYALAPLNRS